MVNEMDDWKKRQKRLEAFSGKLKDFSEEKLLEIRQGEANQTHDSKRRIDSIDKEFARRKPFYSMYDEIVDQARIALDPTVCGFYNCSKPATYYTYVGVKNKQYGIFACREHTQTLYEPIHKCLGNTEATKLLEEINSKGD